jgi:hypothetical protein
VLVLVLGGGLIGEGGTSIRGFPFNNNQLGRLIGTRVVIVCDYESMLGFGVLFVYVISISVDCWCGDFVSLLVLLCTYFWIR